MLRSKCCKAPVQPDGSDEGTQYWRCEKCDRVCDVYRKKFTKKKILKLIKAIRENH